MKVDWLEQVAADVPADDVWLSPSELARLDGMRIPKRRADWRLGRWTAKHAVAAHLNLPRHPQGLAGIEIRPAESGAPEVFLANEPVAISISLSHRNGIAACAVAPAGTMLGCDLEVVEARSDAFLADYFTTEERALVGRAAAADRDAVVNLLWSAKESALKALGQGLRVDTRCVMVGPVEGLSRQQSQINLWHWLRVVHAGGQEFQGWWQQSGELLRTIVAFPATEQPVGL